jgi:acyl-coenzyme A thioesterase PaaI-like protein
MLRQRLPDSAGLQKTGRETLLIGFYSDTAGRFASSKSQGRLTASSQSINASAPCSCLYARSVLEIGMTAEAKIVKAGTTLGYFVCEVKDEQGRLAAKAAGACMKLKRA